MRAASNRNATFVPSSTGFSSRSTRSSFVRLPFACRELTPAMLRRMYSFSFSMNSCCLSKARVAARTRSVYCRR